MEEILIQISAEITRDRTVQLFISKIDLDYAYGQMKLSEETTRQCIFELTGRKVSAESLASRKDSADSQIHRQNFRKKLTEQ